MTDTLQTGSPGFIFAANNDTLTIAVGIFVGSTDDTGVLSTHDGNTLTNNGTILSGKGYAVVFSGNNGTIVNNVGHNIAGQDSGILGNGDHETITNFGTVM